jgi:hypothetical protein
MGRGKRKSQPRRGSMSDEKNEIEASALLLISVKRLDPDIYRHLIGVIKSVLKKLRKPEEQCQKS